MRLVVRQNDRVISEYRFAGGPINIGRHAGNQIVLPDVQVSRKHATFIQTRDGDWAIQDLHSANRTYLNDSPIQQAIVKTGDRVQIADFFIEIDIEKKVDDEHPALLDDTLVTNTRDLQVIVRRLDNGQAPDIRLPATRIKDFVETTEDICRANGLEKLLHVLIEAAIRQFDASRVWVALRNDAIGPMLCHSGVNAEGELVALGDIKLHKKIDEVIETSKFILIPRLGPNVPERNVRSALIAPIKAGNGCFGVIYIDNSIDKEAYGLSDLDYLLLLAAHTAAIVENF